MAPQHDRRSAAARGYGGRWRKERASYLAVNPWCVTLGSGCTRIATVVDHRVPHRGDPVLFWQVTNWQPLCEHCHNAHKQAAESRAGLAMRDHRGRLILAHRPSDAVASEDNDLENLS